MNNKAADDLADLLEQWFPDMTPAERFRQWQEDSIELIKMGVLAALVQPDGDILHKHVEHCTDDELRRALTPEQYRLWMQR